MTFYSDSSLLVHFMIVLNKIMEGKDRFCVSYTLEMILFNDLNPLIINFKRPNLSVLGQMFAGRLNLQLHFNSISASSPVNRKSLG